MEIGKRNEATTHKLRTLKVAMIELSLQGVMVRNETWLEAGGVLPIATKLMKLKNGVGPIDLRMRDLFETL